MKTLFASLFAILVYSGVSGPLWGCPDDEQSAKYHWSKVSQYREFIENPENFEKQGRFSVANDVPDVSANLAALVSLNELHRQEVIIPGLPNDSEHILAWMKFCKRPGIIEATGPGDYQQGEIPLMFTVWYTDEAETAVTKFVGELRAKAKRVKSRGEQGGADQPATVTESKPTDNQNPKPQTEPSAQ